MGLFNQLVTGLFDILFIPFRSMAPIWPLLIMSLIVGVLMVWLFGKVSNQDKVRRVRDRMRGSILAIRLFGDDPGLLMRLQGNVLIQTLSYLRLALIPLLIMLGPVLLVLVQLNLRFEAGPLQPGEQAVVKVKLRTASPLRQAVELVAPDGVTIETSGVRIDELSEVAWRIRGDQQGTHQLLVRMAGETVEKDLVVGERWSNVSARRTGKSLIDQLLYPGEAPISAARQVESVEITYDSLDISLFGWHIHWMIIFFVASLVFGFAFRRPLGVEI